MRNVASRLLRAAALNTEMRRTAAEMAEAGVVYLRGGARRDEEDYPVFLGMRETWLAHAGQLMEAADLVTEAPGTRRLMPHLTPYATADQIRAEARRLRAAAYCRTFAR